MIDRRNRMVDELQLPVQSVPFSTKVVSLNPADGMVYSIQHYVLKVVSDLRCDMSVVFSGYFGFLHQ